MEQSFFHRLSSVLWGVMVALVVLLAIYVSLGRLLTSNLGVYQSEILVALNQRTPLTINAARVSGEWQGFSPVIVLSDLTVVAPGAEDAPLVLSAGRIGVNVLQSVVLRSLQITHLSLDELELDAQLTEQGRLLVPGFSGQGQTGTWLRDFISNVETIALANNRLQLQLPTGTLRNFDFSLRLSRDGSFRRLSAQVSDDAGVRVAVLAEGVGDLFQPNLLDADVYLDVDANGLGSITELLGTRAPRWSADGQLDMELWLSWNRGESALVTRVDGRQLRISGADEAWTMPLQRLAFEAQLVENKNRWTLFANGVEVQQAASALKLPTLQLDFWGEALRVRASTVPLQALNSLVVAVPVLPVGLRDVFNVLQPAGQLPALELSIGNIAAPATDWSVEANFEGVSVNSWRGAPGMRSATGYAEVDSDGEGGFVLLDSQALSMDFPTVYREPLFYDDIFGRITVDWDEQSLRLGSSLITATAQEGTLQALFALEVPFTPRPGGLSMDLLVGLQDAHPTTRVKYVPYVLDEGLRNWLDSSVGDGQVEQGAFLWRGSLQGDAADLRTVQLAFNVAETQLNYHPDWPAVTVGEGVVLIDDTNVSVWSQAGTLFDSRVKQVSAELWMQEPGVMVLALEGEVEGPVSDGLLVLNDSPIRQVLGDSLSDWKAYGELNTHLQLRMDLAGLTEPSIQVDTRWQSVGLDIVPGNLPLRALAGALAYSSDTGFSGDQLRGELWDEPFTASVSEQTLLTYTGDAIATTVVNADARVDMGALQKWLDIDALSLAQGLTQAQVQLRIAAGQTPLLTVDSQLQGVTLDLPQPWNKPAESPGTLHVELPLGASLGRLSLSLADEMELLLDLEGGTFDGGSLGLLSAAPEPEPRSFLIAGHVSLLDADAWQAFVEQYFMAPSDALPSRELLPTVSGSPVDSDSPNLKVEILGLQADELLLRGRRFSDVMVSLTVAGDRWRASAETDWLQGHYADDGSGRQPVLDIRFLDLDGLTATTQSDAVDEESAAVPDFSPVAVRLRRLQRGDKELGNLIFALQNESGILSASAISGELAGLRIPVESPGSLSWEQGEQSASKLKALLQFDDFGQALTQLDYEKILETEGGSLELDLTWPGPPQAFSLIDTRGAAQFKLRDGRFLEASSGASGALKVVSVLNLADIVQRLSLSHMFEAGIPFDNVDGEIFFHGGNIEVATVDVAGPSSFHFSGVSDVGNKRLDGELVATLPVANNLPWVAALAAGLPVAAGVFVVSKVFQKQVDRLSSAVYSISGPWDDPQVTFEHIFDNTDSDGRRAELPAPGTEGETDSPLATSADAVPSADDQASEP